MSQPVRTPPGAAGPARRLGTEAALTLVAMFFVFLALDDITTDTSAGFRPEYTLLAGAGAWLAFFVVQLWRHGRAPLAGVSLVFLIAAAWVAMDGLGHKRDGGWRAFWPEYSTVTLAWVAFTTIAAMVLRQGLRRDGARHSRT